jgi:flagellar assembly protein FliH
MQGERGRHELSGHTGLQGFEPQEPETAEPGEAKSRRERDNTQTEFQRGFAAGQTETAESLRNEYEARLDREHNRINTLINSLRGEFDSLQRKWERIMIEFALAVAERIVKREVVVDKELVMRQIKEALRRVQGVEQIKLRINQLDEQLVRDHRAAVLQGVDSIGELVIEVDEKVPPGGCILESDSGSVDARLSTQLDNIAAALRDFSDGL